MVFLHDTLPQTGFPPQFSTAREMQPTAREFATAVTHKQLVQPSSELTFSPCRSLTIFDLGTEFTEYKCQSVFRSAVPLGC